MSYEEVNAEAGTFSKARMAALTAAFTLFPHEEAYFGGTGLVWQGSSEFLGR